ncbi:MAG: hypothetical protein E7011_01010 [Alphaproteobacteria bacterium]|nr:hypothetical protein [Alphaproteobacteria bacterium]
MTDKINNILLATLWLLISALGSCFWFNSQYGFNIFSGAHWKHLAYMQAAQTPIQPSFYISMVIAVFVIIYVLYLLLRPRIRKISIPRRDITNSPGNQTTARATLAPGVPAASTPAQNMPSASTVAAPAATTNAAVPTSEQIPEINLSRPPRLNIAVTPILHAPKHSTPTVPTQTMTAANAPNSENNQLHKIFESAGYVTKPAPRIAGLQTALCAIGTGETIWIGAVGIKTSTLQSALDTLTQVFSDTLDDIIINVHGFVLSAPDSLAPESPEILTFDTPSTLDKYMSEHTNPPIPATDDGEFDAFSSYISTVIEYLGKM